MSLITQQLFDRLGGVLPGLDRVKSGMRLTRASEIDEINIEASLPDPVGPLKPRLVIPMIEATKEDAERESHFEAAQKLSRQDRWDDLHDMIQDADQKRLMTMAGTPVSDLLSFGARADIVAAASTAVRRGETRKARAIMLELEELLEDLPGLYGITAIVARAHMDVGMAWRGDDGLDKLSPRNRSAFYAHFAHAAKLLRQHDAVKENSPLLASALCTAATGTKRPIAKLPGAYADLIDLDPQCPAHLRALGNALLPQNYGTYELLDREARRAAARTRQYWGHGGYTWVYLDTIRRDPSVLNRIEAESFVAGLHDIVARCPGQHGANLVAALTGVSLARHAKRNPTAARIRESFDWVVRDHLREVHPMLWSLAEGDPALDAKDEPTRIKAGRVRAFSLLADYFAPEIEAGNRVVFENGTLTISPEI